MAQPIKEDKNITKKSYKTKKQPKKVIDERIPPKKNVPVKGAWKKNRKHEDYGTSKLEEKFAKEFLDKLGVKYIYQFKAESIGRYYDFCIPSANLIIEVDGDYWHSKDLVYEEMTPTQKRNKRVDKEKNHWALVNSFKLLRFWESDINKNPKEVMKKLQEELYINIEKTKIIENKKKRHIKNVNNDN
jgi:very-short-patch-repair endonuclease